MRPLVAGNWKMNGLGAALVEIERIATWTQNHPDHADVLVCPPATLTSRAVALAAGRVAIGGQDCHPESAGAFTGEISAEMLKDAGAASVIVGHSERRQYNGETDAVVAAKTRAAWRAGLFAIVCVGETEAQRGAGAALEVVASQLTASVPQGAQASGLAIAYEPIWAIGTGRTPTDAEILEMHRHIRDVLTRTLGPQGRQIRILYGGSVKPANAAEILRIGDVGGALVGGASLKADEFCAIIDVARATI
jgi:triosephosphate isomerase (TIM)